MTKQKICFIFGSGATYDSAYILQHHFEGFDLAVEEKKPPMDSNFFKIVNLKRNHFPALKRLIDERQNLVSMENTWSLIDCGYKLRTGQKITGLDNF